MEISKHCYKRAKERLGLNKKAFYKMCDVAINNGITHKRAKGNLSKWIASIVLRKKYKPMVYLYSDFMLIVNVKNISTVYKIPRNLLPLSKYKIKTI